MNFLIRVNNQSSKGFSWQGFNVTIAIHVGYVDIKIMKLNDPDAYETCYETEIIDRLIPVSGKRILELGCGKAWMTRLLMERFGAGEVVATEVDKIQHERNLRLTDLEGVTFQYGGAEAIDAADNSFDVVMMFKSLHHVPEELLSKALPEIKRVLRPGGLAYFSEPVFWGEFNEIMRLFHDEEVVRKTAFNALCNWADNGEMELVNEVFFQVPGHYLDWTDFEGRFLNVTHTEHQIDGALYQQIYAAFMAHMQGDGVHLLKPHRADLFRKLD